MADEKTPQGGEALNAATGLVGAGKLDELGKGAGAAPKAGDPPVSTVSKRGGDPPVKTGADAGTGSKEPVKGPEPVVVDTPFGKKVYGAKTDDKGNVTLSSFEDVQTFAKTYNLELKDVNDLQGLIKNHGELQESVKTLSGFKKTTENYERTLKSLPTEVSLILDAAIKNQDYSKLITNIANRGTLDFQKDFSDYLEHDLINHYNEQKFTKEEFKEMDEPQFTALKNLAKTRYQTDKTVYQNTVLENQRSTEIMQLAFNTSVETSITQLRSNNPDIGEAQIQRIRDVMTGELQSTLFNPDNTYLPEAAERIAMQEFGAETILAQSHTISDLVQKHTALGKSQANEQILQHSDKRVLAGIGVGEGADENVVSKAVQGATSFMRVSG